MRRRRIKLRRSYLYERPCKRAEGPRSLVKKGHIAKVPRRGTLTPVALYSSDFMWISYSNRLFLCITWVIWDMIKIGLA